MFILRLQACYNEETLKLLIKFSGKGIDPRGWGISQASWGGKTGRPCGQIDGENESWTEDRPDVATLSSYDIHCTYVYVYGTVYLFGEVSLPLRIQQSNILMRFPIKVDASRRDSSLISKPGYTIQIHIQIQMNI